MTSDVPKFNYCDYRCERCDEASECAVNKKIKLSRLKHVLAGKDPDSMETALEEMGEGLQEAMEMIAKAAEEQGIDLSSLEADADQHAAPMDAAKDHPLFKKGIEFCALCGDYLAVCKERLLVTPELEALFHDIEAVRFLIPAKTGRALAHTDDEYSIEDSRATVELILRCLSNCTQTLEKIVLLRPESEKYTYAFIEFINDFINDLKRL